MCEATPFCYKSVIKHIKSSLYTAYLTHPGRVSILSLHMAKEVADSLFVLQMELLQSVISWNL